MRAALEAAKRMQCLNATLQLKTQCWNEIDEREQQHWIDLASVALAAINCQCSACQKDGPHDSDCAVHGAPYMGWGSCNCSLSHTQQGGGK